MHPTARLIGYMAGTGIEPIPKESNSFVLPLHLPALPSREKKPSAFSKTNGSSLKNNSDYRAKKYSASNPEVLKYASQITQFPVRQTEAAGTAY